MRSDQLKRLISLLAVLSVPQVTPAQAAPVIGVGVGVSKVDPNVTRAIATGISSVWQRGPLRQGKARVLIELTRRATPAELDALRAAGAELITVEGRTLSYDRFVPAELTAASVRRLTASPLVARISHASSRGRLMLDRSAERIHLAAARTARPMLGDLTGKGVVIGDIDGVVDPFHPTFFRADGGYFDWIDVDKDGVLTPGTDAIDLDRDGRVGAGEVAVLLPATQILGNSTPVPRQGPAFDPGVDWLFLDSNGNGTRDYGADGGFDDSAPALGEPLFVPDDVNRNGKVELGERVVRLQTSKFKKIWIHRASTPRANDTFERGKNLSATQVNYTSGTGLEADAMHSTGVSTILVGDVPLIGRRNVGMAPEADVLVYGSDGTDAETPVEGVTWALAEGVNVLNYEFGAWTALPLDGSDPLSMVIDTSAQQDGVVHVCPAGNQASARKHGHAELAAGASTVMHFDVPDSFFGQPLMAVELTLHVRGGVPQDVTLTAPNGESRSVLIGVMDNSFIAGTRLGASNQMTARGTFYLDVILAGLSLNERPPVGTWTITVAGDPAKPITVDGYLDDSRSGFKLGAAWDKAIATDRATLSVPAVADHCITVGAYADHLQDPDKPWFDQPYAAYDLPPDFTDREGAVRAFSARGPRIDGLMKPDVLAPDNPWVAMEHSSVSTSPYGSMRVFSGTSGATPHVGGVAALLWQAGLRGEDVRMAIQKGADTSNVPGPVPNGDYGYGRLNAAAALGRTSDGKPFTITLTTEPAAPRAGDDIKLTATAAGDGDATMGLEASWDDGYDGSWDAPYAALAPHALTVQMPGRYPVKVRVRNAGGHIEEAVMVVEVGEGSSGSGCAVGQNTAGGGLVPLIAAALFLLIRRRRRS